MGFLCKSRVTVWAVGNYWHLQSDLKFRWNAATSACTSLSVICGKDLYYMEFMGPNFGRWVWLGRYADFNADTSSRIAPVDQASTELFFCLLPPAQMLGACFFLSCGQGQVIPLEGRFLFAIAVAEVLQNNVLLN